MHKRLLFVLLLVVLGVLISPLSAQDDPLASIDPTGQTITYWNEWAGTQQTAMDQIVAMFNESNEYGITLEQQTFGAGAALPDALSAAITTGELPNIGGNAFVGTAQGWYLDDVIIPLDAYVDSPMWGFTEEERAQLDFALIDTNRPAIAPFDGQLLAWPVGVSANVMSVNMSILDELRAAGAIDFEGAPQSFEQFNQAACASTELTAPDGTTAVRGFAMRGSADEMYSFIFSNGGYIFDAATDAYNFTNENAIEAMQFLQDLYANGCAYYPEGGAFANTGEFSLGLNLAAIGSSVGVPFIQQPMDEAGLEIDWINTTVPYTEGSRSLVGFLRGVSIFAGTPEQNLAAWLFIKYWATNADAQRIWTEGAQYQPYNIATREAIAGSDFYTANPQYASFADVLSGGDARLQNPPAHPRSNEVSEAVATLYTNITINGMDVAQAAAEAEAAANTVYNEVKADLAG
ncbi:MAG: extracellular solute-binding protein [Pleurocapsa minor GSE-CHR-MK-17-07R]|jgi:multiple sugar transport system substrate-binding protein/sn-glycerol 3-phosphate transport system substrate-binding protein|nr:extracellular solute-binding protein [Pleurocapsa minor GSE-CHR-MK 17-07R]